ncbi:MAG: hypothetical protein O2923_01460 [Verrucomicrobia bacterium]|nr:hypothetical protein [Verrucomicrobiota bacterium]MDA1085461.1 hypothetical protein [Verrucomicrobiota bacterium]
MQYRLFHIVVSLACLTCVASADDMLIAEPAPVLNLGAIEVHGNARVRVGYGERNAAFLNGGSADVGAMNMLFNVPVAEDTAVADDISFFFDWSLVRFSHEEEEQVAQA